MVTIKLKINLDIRCEFLLIIVTDFGGKNTAIKLD